MKKLLFAGLVVLAACTGQSEKDECTSDECLKQQAYDKVIAVHDEVMPKLGQISDLKRKLEEFTRGSIDSVTANEYIKLMQDLDAADESMWVWMRAFKSDIEELPLDSALNYLELEQAKVDKVAENINSSIAAAEAALN
jgi:hypothetical protein